MKTKLVQRQKWGAGALVCGLTAAAWVGPAHADTELEWDASQGYHEEEWYDPSDWFNEDSQIDYEDADTYSNDYWSADYDDTSDDDYYEPSEDGYYGGTYSGDSGDGSDTYGSEGMDYGYHSVWDAAEQQWETDYGYHSGTYDIVNTPAENQQQGQAQQGQRDRQQQQGQETQRRQQAQQRQQAQRGQQPQGRVLGQTTVTGTIDGFRQMQLREQGDSKSGPVEQTLARVKLQNGETYVVAMGDKNITDRLQPESGDRIRVSGLRALIDGQTAIIANRLEIGGRSVSIDRQAKQNVVFAGTVAGSGKADLGSERDHLLVNLQLEGSEHGGIVVDFGPDGSMEDLRFDEGSKITVVGEKRQVKDKNVLVARQYSVAGQQGGQAIQQGQSQQSQSKQQQQQKKQQQRGKMASETVTGTIDGFRKLRLRDVSGYESSPVEQTLARVKLQNGKSYVVAIGNREITDKLRPQSGDRLEATGLRAVIAGHPAIIANRLKIGDKTVNIDREAGKNIVFSGEIAGFGEADLGSDRDHLLVTLQLNGGQDTSIVVDFGADASMTDLELQEGSMIVVVGEKRQVGDKAVLVARQYNVTDPQEPSGQEQAAAN